MNRHARFREAKNSAATGTARAVSHIGDRERATTPPSRGAHHETAIFAG